MEDNLSRTRARRSKKGTTGHTYASAMIGCGGVGGRSGATDEEGAVNGGRGGGEGESTSGVRACEGDVGGPATAPLDLYTQIGLPSAAIGGALKNCPAGGNNKRGGPWASRLGGGAPHALPRGVSDGCQPRDSVWHACPNVRLSLASCSAAGGAAAPTATAVSRKKPSGPVKGPLCERLSQDTRVSSSTGPLDA